MSADSAILAATPHSQLTNPSPLAILRARTRDLHTQLEAAIDLASALQSLSTYQALLARYLVLYEAFEEEIRRHSSLLMELSGYRYPSRVAMLRSDLASPAFPSLPASAVTSNPPALPSIDDLDSLLGALYVVEGSSLGGQIIYRQIQETLKLDHNNGAAFFYGLGEQTGEAWKHFTALLDQHILDPGRAAASAAAMFHSFQIALQPDSQGLPTA